MKQPISFLLVALLPATAIADLSLNSAGFTATVVQQDVSYMVKACSDNLLTPTSVGVFHDLAAAPTSSSTPDSTQSTTATPPPCSDVTIDWKNAPIALYQSYAYIDPGNKIFEVNESNNVVGPLAVCVGPDVQIKNKVFTVESQGASVTYKATVCNEGSMSALKFRVGFWHDRSNAPGAKEMGDIFYAFKELKPKECKDIQVSGGLRPNGSFTAYCRPDSGDFVLECREQGKVHKQPYSLSNPDLDVVDFSYSESGGTVTYTVRVCNKGTAGVSKFFTDIYYNRPKLAPTIGEPGDEAKPTLSLGASACTTLTFVRKSAPKAGSTSYAFADPDDFVSEPNEANNLSSPLLVKPGGGTGPTTGPCVDSDKDGYGVGTGCKGIPDCDDTNAKISPKAKEICDNKKDDDCDLTPDDGCPGVKCTDSDGDGFGVGPDCVLADCDDNDKTKYPWAPETCGDNKDDNCNKIADDGCKGRQCVDADMDGYGVGKGCPGQQDCNDADRSVNPGVKDVCGDGVDNDCDNAIDDDVDTSGATPVPCTSSTDGDGDGSSVGGGVKGQPDCDDTDPLIGPTAKEVCGDKKDNDCDGTVDDGCPGVKCTDGDKDGWGVGEDCKILDCDDTNATLHPWATEACGDGKDNDCDGSIDDGCPNVDCKDVDNDSWGTGKDCCNAPDATKLGCRKDCDDANGGASPWATEICGDGKDNDCDGSIDESCALCDDLDKDGHGIGPKCTSWDCDDSDAESYPGAEEICNSKDNDCDGTADNDCTGGDEGCACGVGLPQPPLGALALIFMATLLLCCRRRRR
jgi:Putative metal-binding motif/CARDB